MPLRLFHGDGRDCRCSFFAACAAAAKIRRRRHFRFLRRYKIWHITRDASYAYERLPLRLRAGAICREAAMLLARL